MKIQRAVATGNNVNNTRTRSILVCMYVLCKCVCEFVMWLVRSKLLSNSNNGLPAECTQRSNNAERQSRTYVGLVCRRVIVELRI